MLRGWGGSNSIAFVSEWSEEEREDLVAELLAAVPTLPTVRLEVVALVVRAFSAKVSITLDPDSDVASRELGHAFGDVLLVHHTLSSESFTKDKFEHGLAAILRRGGRHAELSPRGNPGHDITVDGERWSLKTQADRSIKADRIHISKFMELGRGDWREEADLAGLRDRMFRHMTGYDRIFTLRCLSAGRTDAGAEHQEYELVEIPKALLDEAEGVPCVMNHESRQNPKPGNCVVRDDAGDVRFELYFDGGTERKLQVRKLAKSECRVHATWRFPRAAPTA